MNKIGNQIRKTREKKGFTQEVLAIELCITQSNYGRLEKDDNRLTISKLQKIAQILEVETCHLCDKTKIIDQKHLENTQIETVIQVSDNYITSLKDEIQFLRCLLIERGHNS